MKFIFAMLLLQILAYQFRSNSLQSAFIDRVL